MNPLDLHAESFPASGGMAADGMKKLLGTPALSLLQTVIREAVQNSWDARLPRHQVHFQIRLRHLASSEVDALRDVIFDDLPAAPSSSKPMRRFLAQKRSLVLELSDFGTKGLGGPSRANVVPAKGEPNDFVNFVRNMGVRRDTLMGGGTYGYGKSSLYVMSRCSTVLINSVSLGRAGTPVRRLIGCHLGDAHDVGKRERLTGRHWWGRWRDDDGLVEPITGSEAAKLAKALGLPDRGPAGTGTTLSILDPELDDRSLEEVAGEIQETLLWFLWPKMLDNGRGPAIRFSLEVDGSEVAIPHPETFPPLDLFIEAYRAVKAEGGDLHTITCERPARILGHCAIRRGYRGRRTPLIDPEESIIPEASAHIALMRPVELVVKYIEGTALPSEEHEWAGVFICSRDREIEESFVAAEPPAHDDWIPNQLPKGWPKRFVNVALSRLTSLARTYAYPDLETVAPSSDQPSLARAADRLGQLLPFGSVDDGAGAPGGRGATGTSRGGSRWRVSEPRFHSLEEGSNGAEAVFEVDLTNASASLLRVKALPAAIIDGKLAPPEESGLAVAFICWEDTDGWIMQADALLAVPSGDGGTYRMRIRVPDEAAVGVRLEASV